ncbi:hypothetical protein HMPREF3149_05275 [Corynebacterium sp. HMSC05E07]|nr:hypothetical protein HMPREF3149_05275 [Corynebacterium sp. HMSC05E07]
MVKMRGFPEISLTLRVAVAQRSRGSLMSPPRGLGVLVLPTEQEIEIKGFSRIWDRLNGQVRIFKSSIHAKAIGKSSWRA